MDPKFKHMAGGAVLALGAKVALYIPWAAAKGGLNNVFPYQAPLKYLPPWDAWIADLGVPGLMALLSKASRNPATKAKIMDIAKGGLLFGLPEFVYELFLRTLPLTGIGQSYPSWTWPSSDMGVQAPPDYGHFDTWAHNYGGPYATQYVGLSYRHDSPTAAQDARLPFQRDMTY